MKDYEIVAAMNEYNNRYSKALDAVVSAINAKHCDMLNLEAVRARVAETMQALEIKVRYDTLLQKANGKLTCTKDGFELEGHKFDNLSEVEKAFDHKAFL